MISLRRTAAICLRQFYLLRGSLVRFMPLVVWVTVDVVLWGFITKYLGAVTASSFRFVPTLLGAVLLWDFLVRIMQGVTTAFFEDTWTRNFLNIFSTPLSTQEYVLGLVATSIGTSTIGVVFMLAVATAAFGFSFLTYGIFLGPFLLVLFLFGIGLGICACSLVLRFGPAAEWFIWPIPALLSPFAGVFYPVSTLPRWMQAISRLLPPSYVFENMRAIVRGEHPSISALIGSALLAGSYVLLAFLVFNGVYKTALKTGLIARYSAESAS